MTKMSNALEWEIKVYKYSMTQLKSVSSLGMHFSFKASDSYSLLKYDISVHAVLKGITVRLT